MFVEKKGDLVREDGLVERRVQWKDLGVGMTILGNGRKWKIIDSAIPQQFYYAHSLWFRMQAPKGEIVNYPPQLLTRRVTVLLDPQDATVLEPTLPQGAAEAALLVKELGAEEIATQDTASGEIWCPQHLNLDFPKGDYGRGSLLHLRLAHGIDTTGLEALTGNEAVVERSNVHGRLHSGKMKSTGGFPHRHVPEDLSMVG